MVIRISRARLQPRSPISKLFAFAYVVHFSMYLIENCSFISLSLKIYVKVHVYYNIFLTNSRLRVYAVREVMDEDI